MEERELDVIGSILETLDRIETKVDAFTDVLRGPCPSSSADDLRMIQLIEELEGK